MRDEALNIMLHVIILSVILTVMFVLVITKLTKSAFKNEVGNAIRTGAEEVSNKIKKSLPDEIENKVAENPLKKSTIMQNMLKQARQPNKAVDAHNDGVTLLAFSWIAILVVSFILVVFLTHVSWKTLGFITLENVITFVFIGAVEVLFFLTVAFKYIPAPPSLIVETFTNAVADNLIAKTQPTS